MPGETEMSGSAMAHVPDHSGRTGEGRWNRSLPMHMIGRPCWGSDGETAMSGPIPGTLIAVSPSDPQHGRPIICMGRDRFQRPSPVRPLWSGTCAMALPDISVSPGIEGGGDLHPPLVAQPRDGGAARP